MKSAENSSRIVKLAALGFTFAVAAGPTNGAAFADPNVPFAQKLALLHDAAKRGTLVALMSIGAGAESNVPMQHADTAFQNFKNGGTPG